MYANTCMQTHVYRTIVHSPQKHPQRTAVAGVIAPRDSPRLSGGTGVSGVVMTECLHYC